MLATNSVNRLKSHSIYFEPAHTSFIIWFKSFTDNPATFSP